jgi:cell pole-organizing protein PopZ
MAAPQDPAAPPPGQAPAGDPSMEDILASIRRILSEDEAAPGTAEPAAPPGEPVVLALQESMIVAEPTPPPSPEPQPAAAPAPQAGDSIAQMLRTLIAEREQVAVRAGGPSLEDLVRAEIRPLLQQWLDTNLPPLVERLVRAEIERVVGRAIS